MSVTLGTLELTEEQRRMARREIERMAYQKWAAAGFPAADALKYWREAEWKWIGFSYVPNRTPEAEIA